MQISYAFSELGTGLRRNLTMTLAVIVTVWVSLVLFGLALFHLILLILTGIPLLRELRKA